MSIIIDVLAVFGKLVTIIGAVFITLILIYWLMDRNGGEHE